MQKFFVRLLSLLLIVGLLVTPVIAQTPTVQSSNTKVDLTEATEAELAWVKSVQSVNSFIVQLEDPSLATYTGGNATNLAAPQRAEDGSLDVESPTSVAYLAYLNDKIDSAISSASALLGRELEVSFRYDVVLNGFAAKMSAEEAAQLNSMPGVIAVYPDEISQPDTDTSPTFLGVDKVWDGTALPAEVTNRKGEGILVGILDTGINMDHPSFAATGPVDGYVHTNPFGAGVFKGLCATDPTNYVCNDKLVGVYAYTTETIRGEDAQDHGSHTASTTAGNTVAVTFKGISTQITGMAPHANIIAYDVCDADGCAGSATVAAVNQAIANRVKVLNYSIGPKTGPGESPYVSATEVAFLEASNSGIITATSAGNSGPGVATAYKSAPWTLIVGNTYHGRFIGQSVVVNPGTETEVRSVGLAGSGPAFTADFTGTPLKWAGNDNPANPLGCNDFTPGFFTDSIAVISRGTCSFALKVDKAAAAGALAVIIVNSQPGMPAGMAAQEANTIPSLMISKEDGALILALATSPMTVNLAKDSTSIVKSDWVDMINSSSSRGPFTLSDSLVPDLVAPGTFVLAAYDSQGPDTEYGLMTGTSMASPHAAGSLALLKTVFPNWSPSALKSALMLTANNAVSKDYNFSAVDPFDQGAGRIDMNKAALTGLVMKETYANFKAANPANGGDVKTLNVPSYQNSSCMGICSFKRTFTSVLTEVTADYTAVVSSDPSLQLTVEPASFSLAPGATQEVTVTINVENAEVEKFLFGSIAFNTDQTFMNGKAISDVSIPFAVQSIPSTMPTKLVKDITRDSGGFVIPGVQSKAITEFTTVHSGLTPAEITDFVQIPDPTNSDAFDDLSQVYWKTFKLDQPADRLVLQILSTTAGDLDMFFGVGTTPTKASTIASSATASALEYLSFTEIPANMSFWVLIQNWQGTATGDPITFAQGIVYPEANENLTISGPATAAALEPYDVSIAYNVPDMPVPSVWYGMFSIYDSPEAESPISTTEVDFYRKSDDVTKTVSQTGARKGDILTYTISLAPNFTDADLLYTLKDTLPEEVELVEGSLQTVGSSVPATYDASTRTISWDGTMTHVYYNYHMTTSATDTTCVNPLKGTPYVDLKTAYGVSTNPGISGDAKVWSYTSVGKDMTWFGKTVNANPSFSDDGIIYMNTFTVDRFWNYATQQFPNPQSPNDLLAGYMSDMQIVYDAAANKGVSGVSFGSGAAWLVEFDDIQPWDDPAHTMDMEFFAWKTADPTLGTGPDIIIAFDNVTGDWSQIENSIGLENGTGTIGVNYQYNGPTPTSGLAICFDFGPVGDEPVVITYKAEVVTNETDIDVLNRVEHDNDGFNTNTEFADATFHIGAMAEDDFYTTPVDTVLTVAAPGVLANDTPGVPGDKVHVDLKDAPLHGTLVLNQDGSFSYTPNAGFIGTDTFTYYFLSTPQVTGNYLDVATVTINVIPSNVIYLPLIIK